MTIANGQTWQRKDDTSIDVIIMSLSRHRVGYMFKRGPGVVHTSSRTDFYERYSKRP